MEHLERRLVAADAELALQLDRGDARSERGDQEGRVEPVQERLLRPMHDSVCGQRRLLPTLAAKHRAARVVEDELATTATGCATPSVRPAQRKEVAHTCLLVGEQPLELGQRTGVWERRHAKRHYILWPVLSTGEAFSR